MKLYTIVVHNLQMYMKEYRCCLKFRRGDNSTYTFTLSRSWVYKVHVCTSPPFRESISWIISPFKCWTATIFLHARADYWSFVKLCTVVVHYLQMCMKEYGCCPRFKRGDDSTYTFTKRGSVPCKRNSSTSHLQNKLTKNIHLGVATRSSTKWDCLKAIRFHQLNYLPF
jgi:hypothetical protein